MSWPVALAPPVKEATTPIFISPADSVESSGVLFVQQLKKNKETTIKPTNSLLSIFFNYH